MKIKSWTPVRLLTRTATALRVMARADSKGNVKCQVYELADALVREAFVKRYGGPAYVRIFGLCSELEARKKAERKPE